jgi:TRAP-type mannitol/chloroaromatic compound transport system permease large subunit
MKIRKELWFGFGLMALIVAGTALMLILSPKLETGHLGLMMLALVVVAIMLGFPTAFTLMGMGMIFTWLAYDRSVDKTLTLMVQSAFKVMGNDVLISIPLFVFMGYLVERANLIEKLFKSMHLALARVPGSLAVATIFTCAVFATATGIVGAVVTLMGLLALPQMLKGGYDIKIAAGAITAGGCLGILIPPSVMLIVYGATAGVSVVKLYAGAFFPGLMLAGLYIVYVVVRAILNPKLMPPLSAEGRKVHLPAPMQTIHDATKGNAVSGLLRAMSIPSLSALRPFARGQLVTALAPLVLFALSGLWAWHIQTTVPPVEAPMQSMEALNDSNNAAPASEGLAEPPSSGLSLPPGSASDGDLKPPPMDAPAGGAPAVANASADNAGAGAAKPATPAAPATAATPVPTGERQAASTAFWVTLGVGALGLIAFYALLTFERLEIFKMLLTSFFPLVVMILAVLGSIVFGLATPTEAAAVGAFGGYVLAAIYSVIAKRNPNERGKIFMIWLLLWAPAIASIVWFVLHGQGLIAAPVTVAFGTLATIGVAIWVALAMKQARLKTEVQESVFLTAKTSAMVCWLFVGSAIFSAAFALLGGQELVERWVLSMNLTKTEFLILSQVIIFILGWPLEWTEIIVIFMPIFIPLLDNFGVDPLFFGLLVALNLQTAFLSPPVAMAAFYLKGVSPPHVTLNQIFAGMLPFMGIQVIAIVLLYIFPAIGMWLPSVLYK